MTPDQEQSDLGPYCLQYYRLLKDISRQEDSRADDKTCDWHEKG